MKQADSAGHFGERAVFAGPEGFGENGLFHVYPFTSRRVGQGIRPMGTVLVVEDFDPAREVVMRILSREGYKVIGAADGLEAWDSVHTATPDLVLLDLMMPGMDGMTLLTKLRREPGFEDLPVIMLSALSDEAGMRKAKELGAQDYLVKSRFTYDDLVRRVEQHVRH